jgi:hypothetical protein
MTATGDDHGPAARDERLLADLGAAVREAAAVPESFLAAGRAAFAWRTVDAELATLAPREPEPTVVRGAARTFTFTAGAVTIEVEAAEDALVGQIAPAGPGRVELEVHGRAAVAAEVDGLGWFTLRPLPPGLFRLRLTPSIGSPVVTEWLTL